MDLTRLTLISGPRDSGKTRAATALVFRLRSLGLRVGGILSEAEIRSGIKTSYSFVDLQTGRRILYARRRLGPIPKGALVYDFIPEGLEFGRNAIRDSISADLEIMVVDEIGPLEMNGGGLWAALEEAWSRFAGKLILTVRPELLESLKARLSPGPCDCTILLPDDIEEISHSAP